MNTVVVMVVHLEYTSQNYAGYKHSASSLCVNSTCSHSLHVKTSSLVCGPLPLSLKLYVPL